MERWAPIKGHPGYEVSDHGRVRSIDREVTVVCRWGFPTTRRLKGRLVKTTVCTNGYIAVRLSRDQYRVHRLVAAAFVRGDATLTVNHKDGVRANNHFSNLEWVSQSANVKHSYDKLTRKAHAKTTPVVVGGVRYASMLEAAKTIGVCTGSVASAVKRGHRVKGLEAAYG